MRRNALTQERLVQVLDEILTALQMRGPVGLIGMHHVHVAVLTWLLQKELRRRG
jgi:hypothetical protein